MRPSRSPRVWVLTDRRYLDQRMPAALLEALEARGVAQHLLVVDDVLVELGGAADPLRGLTDGDRVVARTRHPLGLALLAEAERRGAVPVISSAAVEGVRDKVAAAQRLAAIGIPTPRTFLAASPRALRALDAAGFPLLLKPSFGDNARGIVLVRGPEDLDGLAWDDGLVLAQRFEDVGGVDCKLYVAGRHVWAVERPSPIAEATFPPQPVPVPPDLAGIARACADRFDLALAGIDVLRTDAGPRVVDVNEFPNFTGALGADEVVADVVCAGVRTPAEVTR
jgi:ribosomal protein S6--L-glutamate ligase